MAAKTLAELWGIATGLAIGKRVRVQVNEGGLEYEYHIFLTKQSVVLYDLPYAKLSTNARKMTNVRWMPLSALECTANRSVGLSEVLVLLRQLQSYMDPHPRAELCEKTQHALTMRNFGTDVTNRPQFLLTTIDERKQLAFNMKKEIKARRKITLGVRDPDEPGFLEAKEKELQS